MAFRKITYNMTGRMPCLRSATEINNNTSASIPGGKLGNTPEEYWQEPPVSQC